MGARGAYQFGAYLPAGADGLVNTGLGPFLPFNESAGLVPPNTFVDDRLEITVAGVRMEIVWVPSEAPDEIVVWLPDYGVLQSAECVQGECYPNLYTIRGDVPRPAAQWVRALDVLRAFPAEGARQEPRPVRRGPRGVRRAPAQLPRRHRVDPRPDDPLHEQGLRPGPDPGAPGRDAAPPPCVRDDRPRGLRLCRPCRPADLHLVPGLQPGRGHGLRPGAIRAPSARLRGGDGWAGAGRRDGARGDGRRRQPLGDRAPWLRRSPRPGRHGRTAPRRRRAPA